MKRKLLFLSMFILFVGFNAIAVGFSSMQQENSVFTRQQKKQQDTHVMVELIELIIPVISPPEQNYSLEDPQDVVFTIDWGSETGVKFIWCNDWATNVQTELINGVDYFVSNDSLVISSSFIASLGPKAYQWLDFSVLFDSNLNTSIKIFVLPSLNPILLPDTLTYDLSNPADVFTSVVYHLPYQVVSIVNKGAALVAGEDYNAEGRWIFIDSTYLSKQFTAADQQMELMVDFDVSEPLPLLIVSTQSNITSAAINPTLVHYIDSMPLYQDVTITWNDASQVTGIVANFMHESGIDVFDWPFYTVTDNGDGTANLRMFFDQGKSNLKEAKMGGYSMNAFFEISFDTGAPAFFHVTLTFEFFLVTVDITPIGGGYVKGTGEYATGDEVTLHLKPAFGYEFLHWENDGTIVSKLIPYIFTMPRNDVQLTAVFIPEGTPTYSLSLLAKPTQLGTVSGEGAYPQGHAVKAKATAHDGYQFVNWTDTNGDIVSANSIYTFSMPGHNLEYTANFETIPVYYNVSFVVTINDQPIDNATVIFNENQILTNNEGIAVFANVSKGTHNFSIIKDGYLDYSDDITIDGQDQTVNITLVSTDVANIAKGNIHIFPNPFNTHMQLNSEMIIQRLVVTNITGQVVIEKVVNDSGQTISTDKLHEGIYFVTLWMENGERVVRKMIKK